MGSIGAAAFTFSRIREVDLKDFVMKRVLTDTTNIDLDATPGSRTMYEIDFKVVKDDDTGIANLATLKGYVRGGSQQSLVDGNWGINESGFARVLTILYGPGGHRQCQVLFERSL